jgi:glycosyltransferase involved in cell wall biosynthesis
VDTQLFRPERQTDLARTAINGNGKLVALYAGLHGIAQGLDQLLEAATAMGIQRSLQFTFIGDGPEKQRLMEQAKRRKLHDFRFLDPRPAHEMPAFVAAADIILVPLKTFIPGAVPSKLYEAMASGRPVVLVADGEAADIVREHQSGIIVRPGDITGLAQALNLLQSEPNLRRTLGENGRRAAELYFDRSRIIGQFIEHLEGELCH